MSISPAIQVWELDYERLTHPYLFGLHHKQVNWVRLQLWYDASPSQTNTFIQMICKYTHTHTHTHIYIYVYIYIFMYIYICIYMYVCVCGYFIAVKRSELHIILWHPPCFVIKWKKNKGLILNLRNPAAPAASATDSLNINTLC